MMDLWQWVISPILFIVAVLIALLPPDGEEELREFKVIHMSNFNKPEIKDYLTTLEKRVERGTLLKMGCTGILIVLGFLSIIFR